LATGGPVVAGNGAGGPATIETGLSPPRPGTYGYRIDGKDAVATVRAGIHLVESLPTAKGTQAETVDWNATGRTVIQTVFGDGAVCRWLTPLVTLPAHPTVEATWQSDSSCVLKSAGTVRWNEQDRVADATNAVVGGQVVPVWVIERHRTQTVPGSIITTTDTYELFAPSIGLPLYRVARTVRPEVDGTVTTTTTTTQLLSTSPSPP
jgi:hypothetical protein